MIRSTALLALVLLLVGCTRSGTHGRGLFSREPAPPPAPIVNPPAPGTTFPPGGPTSALPSEDNGVTPASGVLADRRRVRPILPRRRNPAQPDEMPSPFAPKQNPAEVEPLPPLPPLPALPPPGAKPVENVENAAVDHIAEVRKWATLAATRWAKVDTYEATVTRQELTPDDNMSEDVVLYQFRKEPFSVYIRALDEANAGRELLYRKSDDRIHAVAGKADANIFVKPGRKMPAVSPDLGLVKKKSRYSIREAGYSTPIARVANWADKAEKGTIPKSALTYLGMVERPEFKEPVAGVRLILRPGDDPLMPRGGTRQWFFDADPKSASYGFPILIIATEPNGKDVEYYLFEKLKFNLPFTDAHFSPDRLAGGNPELK